MENVLQTYHLTKRYGNTAVVDGVSMRVPRGEIYGFVGRNGAGKTTVMRMICGLALKSGGGYDLFGKRTTKRESTRRGGARAPSSKRRPFTRT